MNRRELLLGTAAAAAASVVPVKPAFHTGGVVGATGANGMGVEYLFSTSRIQEFDGLKWTDVPPRPTSEKPYLWATKRQDNGEYETPVLVADIIQEAKTC